MAQSSAQETVSKLKELLFDREAREIDTIRARVADIQTRAGSEEQFQNAVAQVLDRAMRDAESARHRELADAMSPMVLRTLRAEMSSREMQDQIAGTMYPRIGEMVARYVSSAIRDLMEEINRRLESGLSQNRFVLRLRSIASGRSMAELALADTQRLEVSDIYLVRRGSGALVHHWSRKGANDGGAGSNRDTLVSGFLAAITALAEEAFEADKESLRTLDLDGHRICLRGSPDHLLAAMCTGSAPAGMERLLDAELIRVLTEHQQLPSRDDQGAIESLLGGLASRVETEAQTRTRAQSRQHGSRTLKVLLWLIGLPLAAFVGWYLYVSWVTRDVQGRVNGALAGIAELKGYPVKAHVERGGRRIWVTGLAPDDRIRREVVGRVKEAAPAAELREALGVLPRADVDAKLGAEGLRRAVERAEARLQTLVTDLAAMSGRVTDAAERDALGSAEAAARAVLSQLAPSRGEPGAEVQAAIVKALADLRQAADKMAAMVGSERSPVEKPPQDAIEGAEALALVADRAAMLAAMLDQRRSVGPIVKRIDAVGATLATRTAELDRLTEERISALESRYRQRISELERQLELLRPAPPSPRQRLETYIRGHAIFFGSDATYSDAEAAAALLAELAPLIREAGAVVRVVGYTDEIGTAARNSPLAQARADRVLADLVLKGAPRELLVGVGRPTGANIASGTGIDSPNRRVEFEIAFAGEKGSRP